MGVLLTILKVIGTILLVVLAVVILLLLLVLLVPVRYSWRGRIDDPLAREELDAPALVDELRGSVEISWLLHLIRASAAWPSGELLSVRILGFRLPVEKFLSGKGKEPEGAEEAEQEEKQPDEKQSLREKLEALPAKAEKIRRKVEYWLNILDRPSTREALRGTLQRIGAALVHFIPKDWHLKGVLGLGDPAASAGVLQVCGFLYPVTDGRLRLDTDFMNYRFDIDTAGNGHIRLIHLVVAAVKILLDRNVRQLIGTLRSKKGAKHVAA